MSWDLNEMQVRESIPNWLMLSYMELQVIRIGHPFFNIIVSQGRDQDKCKGQLVQVNASITAKVGSLLPLPLNGLPLFVTCLKPGEDKNQVIMSWNKKRFGILHPLKVHRALTRLQETNHLYRNFEVMDLKSIIDLYGDGEDTLEEIVSDHAYADLNAGIKKCFRISRSGDKY